MQAVLKYASKPWPTNDPRARTEWDFRAAWKGWDQRKYPFEFLSPMDVWLCHRYEFHRTLPREVTDNLEWRIETWSAELSKWIRQRTRGNEALEKWKTYPRRTFGALMKHYSHAHGLGREGNPVPSDFFYM